jgi:signal transduction histidine kinase
VALLVLRFRGNTNPFRSCVALLVVLLLSPVGSNASAADSKRIVLLHSFGRDFKPWGEYARAIRSELERQSPWRLDIADHSLMTARFSDENPEAPFVEYLRVLFSKQPPDLILSIGAPAAGFVQRHRQDLFGRIPMLFTAVEQRRIRFTEVTPYDTVVAVAHNFPIIVENILHVLPDTKHIAVVTGASPNERFWSEEIRREFKPFEKKVAFKWFTGLSFEEILKQSAALPPNSAIYWFLMSVDGAGISHEGAAALRRLHAVANAPIFSDNESFFGGDLVGGPMHSVDEGAQQAVSVALRILGGERPSEVKVPFTSYATPKFDWRELQRWGISESRLPPGSEVRFREPTAWERYRWQLTSISLALVVLLAITTWLLLERYGRHRAEARSRSLSLEVMHLNRAAEAGALSASFAHDLAQPLVAIALNAKRARTLISAGQADLGKLHEAVLDITHAHDHAARIIGQFRKLLKRESDDEAQEIDINAAIADALTILSSEAKQRRIVLRTEGHGGPLLVRADPVHLLQVLLNLTTNAMDAAADSVARQIVIRTTLRQDSNVEVTVTDSGSGIPDHKLRQIFDTFYTTKAHGTGLGLSIARTIVETYGGTIWAENRAEGGAVIHFIIPLSADCPEQASSQPETKTSEAATAA